MYFYIYSGQLCPQLSWARDDITFGAFVHFVAGTRGGNWIAASHSLSMASPSVIILNDASGNRRKPHVFRVQLLEPRRLCLTNPAPPWVVFFFSCTYFTGPINMKVFTALSFKLIYNIYFRHRGIPTKFAWAATDLVYWDVYRKGQSHTQIEFLHKAMGRSQPFSY